MKNRITDRSWKNERTKLFWLSYHESRRFVSSNARVTSVYFLLSLSNSDHYSVLLSSLLHSVVEVECGNFKQQKFRSEYYTLPHRAYCKRGVTYVLQIQPSLLYNWKAVFFSCVLHLGYIHYFPSSKGIHSINWSAWGLDCVTAPGAPINRPRRPGIPWRVPFMFIIFERNPWNEEAGRARNADS